MTPLERAVDARDGHRSAWTGIEYERGEDDPLVLHHRSNRGQGGDPSKDRLSNLVWLESDRNGLIESDAAWAERARRSGIKISIHAEPSEVAIAHAVHGMVLLDDAGGVRSTRRVDAVGERLFPGPEWAVSGR